MTAREQGQGFAPDSVYASRSDAEPAEVCAGCGDVAEHWRDGGWFCHGCASCEVCQSPYCDNEAHR